MYRDVPLSGREKLRLRRAMEKRAAHYPLQYITGSVEFMGIDFSITPGVFIPRPETELLVETALKAIGTGSRTAVLDLCCGSGVVGLSIARMSTGTEVALSDVSGKAVRLAIKNSERLGLRSRAEFYTGDLFSPLPMSKSFDLIVSNPPYVPCGRMRRLQAEVLEEPARAIDGGRGGLETIRRIISGAGRRLGRDGMLIMEHDDTHKEYLEALCDHDGRSGLRYIKTINDLSGLPRVSVFSARAGQGVLA